MVVRVKKNIKVEKSFIPYENPYYKDQGASIVDDMLEYRGEEIEVYKSDVEDFYTGGDYNDFVWHRSWFIVPRKKNLCLK